MAHRKHQTCSRVILCASTALACSSAFGAPAGHRKQARTSATTNSTAVARFDAAVAMGLPARVALTDSASGQSRATDDLLISARLNGDIVFADGTYGSSYNAMWHGSEAIVTRSDSHLDITSVSVNGVDITGFTAGSDEVEHEHLSGSTHGEGARASLETEKTESLDIAEVPDLAEDPEELKPNRLTFHLVLHDDIRGTSSHHIHAGYVAWWLADFQRRIAPGRVVDVLYSHAIKEVTDIRYGHLGALHDWSDAIQKYAEARDIPRNYRHKFLLITKGTVEPERYGRSWQTGSDGMASINGRYPEIAHQLGHLLGAKHAHAEVRYGGWWCETNMQAPSLILRSNCYAYSNQNMSLMNDYIRSGAGFTANSRWSED